jgi:hypothetical protein
MSAIVGCDSTKEATKHRLPCVLVWFELQSNNIWIAVARSFHPPPVARLSATRRLYGLKLRSRYAFLTCGERDGGLRVLLGVLSLLSRLGERDLLASVWSTRAERRPSLAIGLRLDDLERLGE